MNLEGWEIVFAVLVGLFLLSAAFVFIVMGVLLILGDMPQ